MLAFLRAPFSRQSFILLYILPLCGLFNAWVVAYKCSFLPKVTLHGASILVLVGIDRYSTRRHATHETTRFDELGPTGGTDDAMAAVALWSGLT